MNKPIVVRTRAIITNTDIGLTQTASSVCEMSAIRALDETLKHPLNFGLRHSDTCVSDLEDKVRQASLAQSDPVETG
jgi:hypothetical protein